MTLAALCQVLIALGILNVWILRPNRATPFRPEGATTLAEEFQRYGLPDWAHVAVGSTKLALAALLLLGLVYPPVALPSALLMSLLMLGAILAHVRVGDPILRSVPAASMLIMAAIVVVSYA